MRSLLTRCARLGLNLLILAATAIPVAAQGVSPDDVARIRAAVPDRPIVFPTANRQVLVYSGCQGFRHESIPYVAVALHELGDKTGAFDALVTEELLFKPEYLRRFDAVVLNNTTGELFEDAEMKAALLEFVRDGKGLVGIHAATDCFYQWPEFGALMGGYFDGHPWNEEVTIRADEPQHPLTKMFAAQPFKIADEIYQFKAPYSRDALRVLLSLDTSQVDMTRSGINRTDKDFAVSWIRNYGQGRVFYCSLGHRPEVLRNPLVLQHYLAGLQYAIGDLPADATPSAQLADDGWIKLCNGRDLTGWISRPGSWAVVDGVLTRQGGGDIWSEQAFDDFILDVEFKFAEHANSGVFFRTGDIADCVQTGIEMQVIDSYGNPTPGKHDTGSVYDCLAPSTNAVKPAGEWNHVVLTCKGSSIKIVLNDRPIIDMDLDNWTEPHKNPDGTDNKFNTAYKDMPRRGRIGFQDHGDAVWYRNIRIKPLTK